MRRSLFQCLNPLQRPHAKVVATPLWFVKRWIVSQPEKRFTNHCEDMVVIVVTDIKRQITINAFENTGPIQTTRTARANAMSD